MSSAIPLWLFSSQLSGKELAVVTDASREGDRNSEEEEIDVPEDVEIALGNLFELLTDKVR